MKHILSKKSIKKNIATLVLVLSSSVATFAQFNANPTLKIGDPAPKIDVETWVRGEKLTKLEKGKVYVIDFWATWCGGCIASFPHLSDIAKRYGDRVSFTSLSVYETVDKKVTDPVAKVTEFLKTEAGQKLTLSVGVDGARNVMWDTWIAPLRRVGLPTTYVIDQAGDIAWVDVNLDHLPWVLDHVLAGTWDKQKAAGVMRGKDDLEDAMIKSYTTEDQAIKKSLMTELIQKANNLESQFPDRTDAFNFYKFMGLLEVERDKVPALLEKMAADPLSRYINLSDAAGLTLMKTDLIKREYEAVAKVQERLLQEEIPMPGREGTSVKAFKDLATTYQKAGNNKQAAFSIDRAITLARQQQVSKEELKALQDELTRYRSGK